MNCKNPTFMGILGLFRAERVCFAIARGKNGILAASMAVRTSFVSKESNNT